MREYFKPILTSGLLAFCACFLSMGTQLTHKYTVSVTAVTPGITNHLECRIGGKDWSCQSPHKDQVPGVDPGGPAWAEIPLAYFFHQQENHQQTSWNPYMGSGYPIVIDGHNRAISPSRIFQRFFPTDQGRDVLIFLRFFVWAWAILLILNLLGAPWWYQLVCGLLSTLIPFPNRFNDIVFLDVDMLAPALFLWVFFGTLKPTSKQHSYWFYAFGLLLGFWVGIQTFIQSIIVFGVLLGLTLFFALPRLKQRAIYGLAFFSASYLAMTLPLIHLYQSYFSEMLTNRGTSHCFLSGHFDWLSIFKNSVTGYTKVVSEITLFSLLGLLAILWKGYKSSLKIFVPFYLFLLAWSMFGTPSAFCSIEPLRYIGLNRHLTFYVQSLFFILAAGVGCEWAAQWKTYKKHLFLFFFALLAIYPAVRAPLVSLRHLSGYYAKEIEPFSLQIPKENIYAQIQELSIREDRRHFAPDWRMYPNYSSVFQILDLRSLTGLFPKNIYLLNSQLFHSWHGSSPEPDRFVGPELGYQKIETSLQRLLAVHRVSLLSFSKDQMWLLPEGAYSQKNCKKLGEDQFAQSWLCPAVSGVSYFPQKVIATNSDLESLEQMNKLSPTDLASTVFHVGTQPFAAGKGKILEMKRTPDSLEYTLQVESAGLFVITDLDFPGWQAEINAQSVPIEKINVAFKGVLVPQGQVHLLLKFKTVAGF